MFDCENCHLEFENRATLLRHISHKKACKSYYGEYHLNDMRIEGRLESKKKWWKENGKKVKNSYQQNKTRIKDAKKEKYVCEKQRRCTDEGKAFVKFYEFVYMERKAEALQKLDESRFAYDKVQKQAEEKAIDLVFTSRSDSFTRFFVQNVPDGYSQFDEDCPIEEEVEKAMKESLQYNFDQQIKKDMEKWIDSVSLQISRKCRDQGENSAFNNYFKEFCFSIFPSIQEKSLDFAFSSFEKDCEELNICEEKVEKYLEDRYYESIEELSEKATFDPHYDIGYKLHRKLDSRIAKQVRYMKAFEGCREIVEYGGKLIEKTIYLRTQ